jgi:hypothetical protein
VLCPEIAEYYPVTANKEIVLNRTALGTLRKM